MGGLGPQDKYWGVRALEFVDAVEAATTPVEVTRLFEKVIGECGFHAYVLAGLTVGGSELRDLMLADGWPAEWSSLYMKERYFADDPIPRHCLHMIEPFEWKDAPYDRAREPRAHEVMTRALDFRMNHGFTVPIHYQEGGGAVVSLAAERADFGIGVKPALHLMSLYAHSRIRSILRPPKEPARRLLTEREREVLRWAAVGKTSWEIGQILGISERTAKAHLQSAADKLKAFGRTATVVAALRLGEITL